MDAQVISPSNMHPTAGYSHAVRVGDFVFVAGQVALDPQGNVVGKGDARAQAVRIFENLRTVLESAGSGLDCIVKQTTYITSLDYRPLVNEVRQQVFEPLGYFPPSTLAVISSLATPDYLVEIEAIARIR
jgi:2-iminobutanoate/2-iminopropanoate deaminase